MICVSSNPIPCSNKSRLEGLVETFDAFVCRQFVNKPVTISVNRLQHITHNNSIQDSLTYSNLFQIIPKVFMCFFLKIVPTNPGLPYIFQNVVVIIFS